jgi:hypothetical protein
VVAGRVVGVQGEKRSAQALDKAEELDDDKTGGTFDQQSDKVGDIGPPALRPAGRRAVRHLRKRAAADPCIRASRPAVCVHAAAPAHVTVPTGVHAADGSGRTPRIHTSPGRASTWHTAEVRTFRANVAAPLTVATGRALLVEHRNFKWILNRDWAGEFFDEIRALWHLLRSANGHAASTACKPRAPAAGSARSPTGPAPTT